MAQVTLRVSGMSNKLPCGAETAGPQTTVHTEVVEDILFFQADDEKLVKE